MLCRTSKAPIERYRSVSHVTWREGPAESRGGTHLVRASLFLFSKLWPVSAPLSLAFINPKDCRVGKTGSRS